MTAGLETLPKPGLRHNEGMTVRDATEADLPVINTIYNHYVRSSTCTFQVEPTSLEERRAWFEAHGTSHPVIVVDEPDAAEASNVTAWASLSKVYPREAYDHTVELSVYVRHDRRGRGLGRQLVNELLARARRAGHHVVIAQVSADQSASLDLHRELGFREAGILRQVGFKFERWLDVVLFDFVLGGGGAQPHASH